MIALASLLFAQVVLPSGEGMSVAQRVEVLGEDITAGSVRPLELFEDADLRAAMKRVGVEAGCPVAADVARTTAARFGETLSPFAETAVRETIPAERLEQFRPVSFLAGGAGAYRSRVDRKFEAIAAEPLARARDEARAEIIARMAALPDFVPGPDAAPPIDPIFESSFGADASKTWDSAPLLSLACLQRDVPPGLTIQHDDQTFPPAESRSDDPHQPQ